MENGKSIVCISFMIAVCMTSALPILNTDDQNIPWAHPCTPIRPSHRMKRALMGSNFIIDSLKEKTEDSNMFVKILLESMEKKYFADTEVIKSLQKLPVQNFPAVTQSDKKGDISIYNYQFAQLSKAAVFLEMIKIGEDDEDLLSNFDILFTDNLQLMCEIHLALNSQNVKLPPPTSRSIMSPELRKSGSTFSRYERDYRILYQYKLLLENHLTQYKHITE